MELRDLKYFALIARHGSVSKAALAAHRTQPALTKSLQRLEAEFGVPLFERRDGQLTLTSVGRLLQQRCGEILQGAENAKREVQEAADGTSGHVRLGVSTTAAEFLLPSVVDQLLRRYPKVTLEIEYGMNDELATALSRRAIDLAIGPFGSTAPELDFIPLCKDRVVVVARSGHPLFRCNEVRMEDLVDCGWILPSKSASTRLWLESAFERRGLKKPLPHIESNTISFVSSLISGTDLLSFITRRNLEIDALKKSIREIPLEATTMTRNFGILVNMQGYYSPSVEVVLELFRQESLRLMKD